MIQTQDFLSAKGSVVIPMTNDYLFRALLQENHEALIGLVSSLFHMNPNDIKEAIITNPIELGKSINSKEFTLDIAILLNSNKHISLEMQVCNQHNWVDRSLSYLCRKYDNVAKGCDYISVTPVVQVDFLDFTLFPDHVKFYSKNLLMDIEDYYVYSRKFELRVIDLTHTDIATDEDKAFGIDKWASFFKANTWEVLKMLAQENNYIASAAQTVYKLTADEKIRMQCEALEENLRVERGIQKALAEKDKEIAENKETIKKLESKIAELEKLK